MILLVIGSSVHGVQPQIGARMERTDSSKIGPRKVVINPVGIWQALHNVFWAGGIHPALTILQVTPIISMIILELVMGMVMMTNLHQITLRK